MGMYDSIYVHCPKCGECIEFQSKSGDCILEVYTLENCPEDVLANANRHSPMECSCGAFLEIDTENRKIIEAKGETE